jgi:hypothetical protein
MLILTSWINSHCNNIFIVKHLEAQEHQSTETNREGNSNRIKVVINTGEKYCPMVSYREHWIFLLFQMRILAEPLWDKAHGRVRSYYLFVTHHFQQRHMLTSCKKNFASFDFVPESLIIL